MEAIARLGALECLRSGITTVGDCSFSGAAATACAELGSARDRLPRGLRRDASALVGAVRAACASASPTRSRIACALGISPHAPYTCTLELYEACAELGLPIATHLAESEAETEFLQTGEGTWQAFAEMLVPPLGTTGITGARRRRAARPAACSPPTASRQTRRRSSSSPPTTSRSRTALARTGTSAAASRRCATLREAGIRVSIATDSPASTPSFDMFDEMRAAIVGARARERRPDALSASDALELATLGGARALGLEREIGSLVPGQVGGSHRSLACRLASSPVGRSRYGNRSRRLARRRPRYSRLRHDPLRERREDMARADRRRSQRARPAPPARRRP